MSCLEFIDGDTRDLASAPAEDIQQLGSAVGWLLPLPDASLAGALTVNTLYFVDDLPAAVHELRRVLRPGGRLAVGIGDPQTMQRLPFTRHGFNLRPAVEVIAAFGAGGLALTGHDRVGDGDGAFHLLRFIRS